MPFAGSHGGVGGAVVASAPGSGSAVVRMIRVAVFFPGDPAGGTGGVGAAGLALFWWQSSGFSQAKMTTYRRSVCLDLAGEMSSGKLRRRMEQCIFCLEFAGSGGIRSLAPMLLFRPFGSGGSGAKLFFCVDIK